MKHYLKLLFIKLINLILFKKYYMGEKYNIINFKIIKNKLFIYIINKNINSIYYNQILKIYYKNLF